MGSNEKFCLRWNDFESNISVAFREIREEKDFFDCTLSCGSRQIQAHKLILSACSPFFRSILRQNPHQHPLLFLKGVQFTDLQSVLSFMYHGEVNVAQEELNSFLSVAEDLQVKGLTQNNIPSNISPKPEKALAPPARPRPSRDSEPASAHKVSRPASVVAPPSQRAYQPHQEEIQEMSIPVVKTEPQVACREEEGALDTMGTEVASMEESYSAEGYDDYSGYEGQEYEGGDGGQGYAGQGYVGDGAAGQKDHISNPPESVSSEGINANIIDDPNGLGFTCVLCGKGFGVNKHHCKRHIKNAHFKVHEVLTCDYCQRTYKNIDSLRDHQRKAHGLYKQ